MHTQYVSCPTIAISKVLKFLDIIDFKKISDLVTPKIRSKSGRAGFAVDSMIKATFLGNYYGLSDRAVEDELQIVSRFEYFAEYIKTRTFPIIRRCVTFVTS